jgi:cytidine deaminase
MPSPEDLKQLARRALAATATALLSGPGGTRYGAAVLTASGRIFESGQYSSFNHQTGVHAEQAALVAAVAAGHPDVVALAVASTKAKDATRLCGTCRQIILEHSVRCGRSIEVVMVGPDGSHDVRPIEALLPASWLPTSAATGRDAATRFRAAEPQAPQRLTELRAALSASCMTFWRIMSRPSCPLTMSGSEGVFTAR